MLVAYVSMLFRGKCCSFQLSRVSCVSTYLFFLQPFKSLQIVNTHLTSMLRRFYFSSIPLFQYRKPLDTSKRKVICGLLLTFLLITILLTLRRSSTAYFKQTAHFFNKNEIVTYHSQSDLSEKILKYNKDDKIRKKIAKNGREKYFKYFNSKIIADFIIKRTYGNKKKFCWENFL